MKAIAATTGPGDRRDFFWLDSGFGMQASSPQRGLGFNLRFGGIFVTPPTAVSWIGPGRLVLDDVVLATEVAARETSGGGGGGGGAAASTRERTLAHDLRRGPFRSGPPTERLDLFGLGLDYALYHKTFFDKFDQDELGPWHNMGGTFTSVPAAIAWGSRIDVLGVGLDHAMYQKTLSGNLWSQQWKRLGGSFTSAASMVVRGDKLDAFARGADFTLRGNQTDGTTWFTWQNHGGQLASAPVAVSWGADRIDVFAIFKDGALWHIWWDGQLWNEWESLGGSYVGEPAAVSWAPGRLDVFAVDAASRGLRHHWFESDTWSLPEALNIGTTQKIAESVTVVSSAANRLELFVPTDDHQIRRVEWDGQQWQAGSAGANFRSPCRYRMSVDGIKVNTTRALNADTDAAMAAVAAGNAAVQVRTQWIGEIGGLGSPKTSQTNLLDVDPVSVDLAEPMSYSYIVVNNGHADQAKILAALAAAGDSLSLAGSSSMQEDIAKGVISFVSVKIAAAISIYVPVVGPALGVMETWLMDKLKDALFESCDGVVAVELRAMMGRDLYILTGNGAHPVQVTTQHPGAGSPTACGDNSDYEVTWTIKPL